MHLKDDSEKGVCRFHQTAKEVYDPKKLKTLGSCYPYSGKREDKERDVLSELGDAVSKIL